MQLSPLVLMFKFRNLNRHKGESGHYHKEYVFLCKFSNIPGWRIALPAKSKKIYAYQSYYFKGYSSRSPLIKRVTIQVFVLHRYHVSIREESKKMKDTDYVRDAWYGHRTVQLICRTVQTHTLPVHGFQSTVLWWLKTTESLKQLDFFFLLA